MLKSNKNVFWEALVVTVLIFLMGLFLGMLIETGNSNKISNFYINSEIDLVDGLAILELSKDITITCDALKEENINFANRIYDEAVLLEEYESAGILTDNLKILHKQYDLLRTLIWIGNQEAFKRCNNYGMIVYLYEYNTEDPEKTATQNVWSKALLDLKNENKDLLLIPIAADQNLSSLEVLIKSYNIKSFPAVVVNNKDVLYKLEDLSRIDFLLDKHTVEDLT